MARRATQPVRTPSQWDALLSGPRLELYLTLVAVGPASAAELAAHLDRPPDRLYHHLHRLTDAGLVREVERRPTVRRSESVYDAVAERLEFDTDADDQHDPIARLARTILRQGERLFERALRSGRVRLGEDRNTTLRADAARLTDDQLAEVIEHLDAVAAIFEAGRTQTSGTLHALSLALNPVVRTTLADEEKEKP